MLLGVLAFRAWRRTRRRRHDPDDRRRVLGAWTEALERLAAAGIERRPVDHVARVRAAPGARARRGRGRSAADGPRAPAHRRDVLARRAVARRSRRSVGRGRRDRRRRAIERAPYAGAGARAGGRSVGRRSRCVRRPAGVRRGRGSALMPVRPSTNAARSRRERAHVGVDVGRDLIDRDEQRELAGAQRVEDLAVVVAGPHVAAVGDEPQARQIVPGVADRSERDADPCSTAAPRRAATARRAARRDRESRSRRRPRRASTSPLTRPVPELRDGAAGEPRRLRGGEAHRRGSGIVAAEAVAPLRGRGRRTCRAARPARAVRR